MSLVLISPLHKEALRKALHLPTFVFPLLAAYSKTATILILLGLAFFYFLFELTETRWTQRFPAVNNFISHFKRSEKIDPTPIYLAFGMAITLLLTTPVHGFFAAYTIAICDSAASLVGMYWGKHKIGKLPKSWEGSLAFFVLCLVGGMFFMNLIWALGMAFLLTLIEMASTRGHDNLFLPIFSQLPFFLPSLIKF